MIITQNQKNNTDDSYFESMRDVLVQNPDAGQRDLAYSMNLSLGTTNALLRRFCEKGWMCVKKINAHNIQYLVTPQGLNILAHRSYNYLRRTYHLMQQYQTQAECLIKQFKKKGIKKAVIQNETDLGFVFEGACAKYGIKYSASSVQKLSSAYTEENCLYIVENEQVFDELKQNDAKGLYVCNMARILV